MGLKNYLLGGLKNYLCIRGAQNLPLMGLYSRTTLDFEPSYIPGVGSAPGGVYSHLITIFKGALYSPPFLRVHCQKLKGALYSPT